MLENFLRDVSIIKWNSPRVIPDCATIALATKKKIPAVFAKNDEEFYMRANPEVLSIEI